MKYKQLVITVLCLFVLAGSVSCSSDNGEETQQDLREDTPVATETPQTSPSPQEKPTETPVIEEEEEITEPEPEGPK